MQEEAPKNEKKPEYGGSLFYTQCDIFPLDAAVNNKKNIDDNCNYVVQEPVTPSSDNKSRKNSCQITEKWERPNHKKLWRHRSDASMSFCSPDKKCAAGSPTKGKGNYSFDFNSKGI